MSNDAILGGHSDDTIIAGLGNDTVSGNAGVDIVDGGEGDDVLWGGEGKISKDANHKYDKDDFGKDDGVADTIITGPGKDTVYAGHNDNVTDAGKGIDHVYGNEGRQALNGGDDTDGISGGGVADNGQQASALAAPGAAPQGSNLDSLYGGDSADIFEFGNRTMVMDATKEDYVSWAGFTKQITGGVQQFWMEGNWAYYTPFSGIIAGGSSIGLLSDLLYAQSVLTDLAVGANFRFGLTTSHQLLIQIGRGRAGVMVMNDYDLDLGDGTASGHVVAYQLDYRDGKSATLAQIKETLNLALHASFGLSYPGADPLMIDLDGDGLELSRENASKAYWDFDGDSFAEHTAWAKKDDGFIARDINNNGKIDGMGELFGNATTSGLAALKVLDSNNDNKITSADSTFGSLRIWQDADADGVSDAGELKTFAQAGIKEISLVSQTPSSASIRGSAVTAEATFTRTDNTTGKVYDVQLDHGELDTKYLGNSTVSPAAAALPTLKGYGNLPNLNISMTSDATLLNLVTAFKNLSVTSTWATLLDKTDDILFRWAGVQGVAKTAIGTGGLDTQKLAFLEKYFGYQLLARDGSGNPVATGAAEVLASWNDVLQDAAIRLAAQGPMKSLLPGAPFDTENDSFLASNATALADSIAGVFSKLSATSSTALTQWNTNWSKVVDGYADAMMRSNNVEVRDDYLVQSLVKAMDGLNLPLSLQQLIDGLGMNGVHIGTSGNDTLSRGSATGLQVFIGGAGDDTMTGGVGQDVYVFGRNFGRDVIVDTDNVPAGDRIRLAVYNPSDVTVMRSGDNLLLTVTATGDSITVKDHYKTPTYDLAGVPITPDRAVEEIQFADGTVMEAIDISAKVGLGTNGNDTINGSSFADEIEGLLGNDLLKGGDNGDCYYYTLGDGNDTIQEIMVAPTANAPDSLALLGNITESDLIFTRNGNSPDLTISFASGAGSITIKDQFKYNATGFETKVALDNRVEVFILEQGGILDWLQIQDKVIQTYTTDGNDTVYGFGTSDTLYVSEGNDSLVGLDGGDTYTFASGIGHDTVHDQSQYPETFISGLVGYSWGADDVIAFAPGITAEDVSFSRPSEDPDLVITLKDTGDSITVLEQFTGIKLDLFNLLGVAWFDRVEKFEFSDGTTLTWEDILKKVTTGTESDDSLYGVYYDDTLDGGAGDDLLSGGDESDTYLFGKGDGHDVIDEHRLNVLSSDNDTIRFKSGVTVSDVAFLRDSANPNDLIVTIKSTGESIRIVDHYAVAYTGVFADQYFNRIEKFIWADGTVKTAGDITADIIATYNTPGNGYILGTPAADTLNGGAGDDFMNGRDGADIIYGGFGTDTITFGTGITWANTVITRTDQDTVSLQLAGGGSILLKEALTSYGIETFKFSDGTTKTQQDMKSRLLTDGKTSGNDIVIGFEGNDTLAGGAGNDLLRAYKGSDTLDGGAGADTLDGSLATTTTATYAASTAGVYVHLGLSLTRGGDAAGDTLKNINHLVGSAYADTFSGDDSANSLSGGNGNDTLEGGAGADTIDGGGGTDAASYANSSAGVSINLTTNSFSGSDATGDSLVSVEYLTGSAYGDTLAGNGSANKLLGGAGDDILIGEAGNDTLDGEAGNDQLTGGTGNDSLLGGDGSDTLEGGVGSDTLNGGAGLDSILYTNAAAAVNINLKAATASGSEAAGDMISGVERVVGSAWNDTLTGSANADTLEGGAGNDTISGDSGADSLMGDDGNDSLSGAAGIDTLVGGLGVDTLNGGTEADTYRFGTDDTGLATAADHIVGFSRTQGDKIEFNMSGISASGFVGTGAFASGGGKEFGYTKLTSGTGVKSTVIRIDFDDDGVTDREIVLDGIHIDLTVGDFLF